MLRQSLAWFAMLSIAASPAHAGSFHDQAVDVRGGAFVGARLQLSLGGRERAKPRAALAIAPTRSTISRGGLVRTRIGEGLALTFAPSAKPTLTLAGVRADQAFKLQRAGQTEAQRKLGISTGGWIAIGVGVAVLAGGIYFVHLVREADKNSD